MVRVRLYGSLRAVVGSSELSLEASSLTELLGVLKERYERLSELMGSEGFVVLVNERPVPLSRLDAKLDEEDVVDILPVVSGGRSHSPLGLARSARFGDPRSPHKS